MTKALPCALGGPRHLLLRVCGWGIPTLLKLPLCPGTPCSWGAESIPGQSRSSDSGAATGSRAADSPRPGAPWRCGRRPGFLRGQHHPPALQHYFDGGLSNILPFSDCPNTITVSPFTGTVDICPPNTSASIHEMQICNANFQISTMNLYRCFSCLIFPTLEVGVILPASLEGIRGLAVVKGCLRQTLCLRRLHTASGRLEPSP